MYLRLFLNTHGLITEIVFTNDARVQRQKGYRTGYLLLAYSSTNGKIDQYYCVHPVLIAQIQKMIDDCSEMNSKCLSAKYFVRILVIY